MKVGLVGNAHWAQTIHAPGLSRSNEVKFSGVWARNLAKASELALAHNVTAFADFDEMLDQVDAVSFAVPPKVQSELAQRAAARGKHVLLEKPIAASVTDGLDLARAVDANGVRSVVFLTRLFHPGLRAAITSASQLGGWSNATMRIVSNTMRIASPFAQSAWRQEPLGALWDIGPHLFSVLQAILGPITVVHAQIDERGHILISARHKSGTESRGELSLHACDADMANETLLEGSHGEFSLPIFDMVNGGAAMAYEAAILQLTGKGSPEGYCDVHSGLDLLRLLQKCDDQLRASTE